MFTEEQRRQQLGLGGGSLRPPGLLVSWTGQELTNEAIDLEQVLLIRMIVIINEALKQEGILPQVKDQTSYVPYVHAVVPVHLQQNLR